MRRLLERLFDPAYLYAIDPGPLGKWSVVYIAWALLLLGGLLVSLRQRKRSGDRTATISAIACGAGLFLLTVRFLSPRIHFLPPYARFLLLDVWTARVWPISATLTAIAAALLKRLPRIHAARRHSLLLVAIHLAGLGWLWHAGGGPLWLALPTLLLLLLLPALAPPHRLHIETLSPLFLSYASSLLSFFLSRKLGIDVDAYQGFRLPDPWSPWFNAPVMTLAGVMYTLWLQLELVSQRWQTAARTRLLPLALITVTALWLLATTLIHRPHGVTASDPYCYTQMAIDLVETGSPLHDFPLAGLAQENDLPTWPAVHIGYHPPFFATKSPTMWSIGWPALMTPFYWLGGLDALYFAAPVMAALALIGVWLLVNDGLRAAPRSTRWPVAALTCLLVATSPENAERMLAPMADAAAQLFTVLMLWLLLRGQREHPVRYGILSGVCFGLAFFIRHPLLPLGVAALVAKVEGRRKFVLLFSMGLVALLSAAPDLLYHKQVFGGWLKSESTEWFLLSPGNIGRSFLALLEQGLLRREELGFIIPFALGGCALLWKRHRNTAYILWSGFLAVFLFHLCYEAVRPRDLVALLPLLYLPAAYGLVYAGQYAARRKGKGAALISILLFVSLAARSYRSLEMPWRTDVITFGYLSAEQRQAFQELDDLLPQNAVVASMLNGGAIELYTGHKAFHPAPWTPEQCDRWIETLQAHGHAVYFLDDGEEMTPILRRLRTTWQIRMVRRLGLPYFARGGGNLPATATLYVVSNARQGRADQVLTHPPAAEIAKRQNIE